jgi:methyl-accepting chemotaxis protein
MKIRSKITLSFLFLTLASGFVSLFLLFLLSKSFLRDISAKDSETLSRSTANALDRIVYRRMERWDSYIHSNPDLVAFIQKSNLEFSKNPKIDDLIASRESEWVASVKSGKSLVLSKELIENTLAKSLKLQTEYYNKNYGYNIFPEIFVTNQYGASIASTDVTSDYIQSDEEWWQKAKESRVYFSDVVFDESSKTYSIEIALRIDDDADKFLGVLKVIYDIRDLYDVATDTLESNEGLTDRKSEEILLLTKEGNLIYSSKEGFVNLKQADSYFLPTLFAEKEKNSGFFFIKDPTGTEKIFSYSLSLGYKDFKSLGWFTILAHNSSEVLAPVYQLACMMGGATLLSVVLAVLVGFLLSKRISDPIKKLQEGMKVVESGKLDYKVVVNTKDETAVLARAFNEMASKLSGFYKGLEEKVKERTAEVEEKNKKLEASEAELKKTLDMAEKTNKLMVGRELKMKELKEKIKGLENK